MKFSENDQIEYSADNIKHKSAGGFIFFEEPLTHELFIALLRNLEGQYVIPKGHIQKNEDPKTAAIREVKEELSLQDTPKIISFLGIDSYTFILDESGITHYKDVYLYVFQINKKVDIKPLKDEGFETAEWLPFEIAVEKIYFDRENLLKAKQYFYYYKLVKIYQNLQDILSITIAIPTYNGAKTIKNTLYSVAERLKELPCQIKKEVIICTDHCNDNTKTIVKDFIKEKRDLEINIIDNNGPKGKAAVLNKIFNNSSGELFCTVDDDVILAKNCLLNLLNALIIKPKLRCVFSVWKKLPLKSRNPWKLFWHWVFGIKFDIQPYDKPSEIMKGTCMMFRKENFVQLPSVLNEDQFLQYIYWPKTLEVQNSIIYFNSVSGILDYYKRFIRITVGFKQMSKYFSKQRINECNKSLLRKIDYQKIINLPQKQKYPFLFYRFIRFFINIYVKNKIRFREDYEWFRIKQN